MSTRARFIKPQNHKSFWFHFILVSKFISRTIDCPISLNWANHVDLIIIFCCFYMTTKLRSLFKITKFILTIFAIFVANVIRIQRYEV